MNGTLGIALLPSSKADVVCWSGADRRALQDDPAGAAHNCVGAVDGDDDSERGDGERFELDDQTQPSQVLTGLQLRVDGDSRGGAPVHEVDFELRGDSTGLTVNLLQVQD